MHYVFILLFVVVRLVYVAVTFLFEQKGSDAVNSWAEPVVKGEATRALLVLANV